MTPYSIYESTPQTLPEMPHLGSPETPEHIYSLGRKFEGITVNSSCNQGKTSGANGVHKYYYFRKTLPHTKSINISGVKRPEGIFIVSVVCLRDYRQRWAENSSLAATGNAYASDLAFFSGSDRLIYCYFDFHFCFTELFESAISS